MPAADAVQRGAAGATWRRPGGSACCQQHLAARPSRRWWCAHRSTGGGLLVDRHRRSRRPGRHPAAGSHARWQAVPASACGVGGTSHRTCTALDWWREVWPFQWRISTSYLCGIFIVHILVPAVSWFCGPGRGWSLRARPLGNQALRAVVRPSRLSVVSAKSAAPSAAWSRRARTGRSSTASSTAPAWPRSRRWAGSGSWPAWSAPSPLIGTHWRHWDGASCLMSRSFVVLGCRHVPAARGPVLGDLPARPSRGAAAGAVRARGGSRL